MMPDAIAARANTPEAMRVCREGNAMREARYGIVCPGGLSFTVSGRVRGDKVVGG
jgi:hypothetical protein